MGEMDKNIPSPDYLLKTGLTNAEDVRKKTDEILYIKNYCTNEQFIRLYMEESAEILDELNKKVRILYGDYNPSQYKCSGEANIALLRSVVTTGFIRDLFYQLLNMDFCEDNETLKFFLDTMRRISFDVDIILDLMILLNNTYLDCPISDAPQKEINDTTVCFSDEIKSLSKEIFCLTKEIELKLNEFYATDPVGEPALLNNELYCSIQKSLEELSSLFYKMRKYFNDCPDNSTELQITRWLIDALNRVPTVSTTLAQIVILKDSCSRTELCVAELNFTSALLSFDMIQADVYSINALINGGE